MRPSVLALALVVAAALPPAGPCAARAVRQETETPSSRPLPEPGAPSPPTAAPREGPAAAAAGADREAAAAAVRTQCTADRSRLCRSERGDGVSCLSVAFAKLSPDCQAAVTTLREVRAEH